ncbi:MAG: hypothetical protein AB7N65_16865 [Vicinamibacterales bacterium]
MANGGGWAPVIDRLIDAVGPVGVVVTVALLFICVVVWAYLQSKGGGSSEAKATGGSATATGGRTEIHQHFRGVAPEPQSSGAARLDVDLAKVTLDHAERRLGQLKKERPPRPPTREDYRFTPAKKAAAVFTPRTLRELSELAETKPSFKRQEAIATHKGMWIHLQGVVTDIQDDPNTDVIDVSMACDGLPVHVALHLDRELANLAKAFVPGVDGLEVNGRILHFSAGSISLAPVEIVRYGPDVKQVTQ